MNSLQSVLRRSSFFSVFVAGSLLLASCGADDGATVRDIGSSEPGGGSGSSSAPATGGQTATEVGDGGYEYASNVDAHRLVVEDLCGIGDLVDSADFDALAAVYRDGGSSVNSDGTVRTIGGFAASEDRRHGLDIYYESPTPLDDFVTSALEGSGMFAGQSDEVRGQGVEKGMQNQVLVAWLIHELESAIAKADEGNFDRDEGAAHNWDEGWAFYHGSQPGCGPFVTADKRAADFATVADDGVTALANESLLEAMISGREALVSEDADGARMAMEEVWRQIVVVYSQASVRYATLVEDDNAVGDAAEAKIHQAEGLAFWRVIEASVAAEGADVDTVNAIFDLGNEPGANGHGGEVRAALEPAWESLGISADQIGDLVN